MGLGKKWLTKGGSLQVNRNSNPDTYKFACNNGPLFTWTDCHLAKWEER